MAACLLLYLSDTVSPQQAIDSLRDLRGSGAIQTIKVRRLCVPGLGTVIDTVESHHQEGNENPKHSVSHISPAQNLHLYIT